MQFDPLMLIGVAAIAVIFYAIGRRVEQRRSPLWLEGRLLDRQKRIAEEIATLKIGETAEEVAEKARQTKVRADILALDQRNQTP